MLYARESKGGSTILFLIRTRKGQRRNERIAATGTGSGIASVTQSELGALIWTPLPTYIGGVRFGIE